MGNDEMTIKSFRCPVCLKAFEEQRSLRTHMRRKRHTIDGAKSFVRGTPEYKLAEYHREKTGEPVSGYRYGDKVP